MPSMTHALLLCAGLGTRLQPLTSVRSKPAIPVAGEPMVRRIMRWLAASGVREIVLNLHHLPHTLTAVVGDGSDMGVRARYSWEQPDVLGSAGGPRQALDIIGTETFLIVNGDTLTDLPLPALEEAHQQSGALATLALVPNTEPHRYGGVLLADDGAVTGFARRGSTARSWHFIGVQIAHRDAFRGVPPGRAANSIGEVYDALIVARPGSVRGHACDASFWDVGTVADYWATSRSFAARGVATAPARTRVADTARLTDVILWDDVVIEGQAVIERCIVTDGVRVPAGSTHASAILMRGPDGATLAVPFPELT
jgi:NDP-sugar pyrophosphorylase family protein